GTTSGIWSWKSGGGWNAGLSDTKNSTIGQNHFLRFAQNKVNATNSVVLSTTQFSSTVLTNTTSTHALTLSYSKLGDHLRVKMNVSTYRNTNKFNISGYYEVIDATTTIRQLYFQLGLNANYEEYGAGGAPNCVSLSNATRASVTWNWTASGFGIIIPSGSGIVGIDSNCSSGNLYLVNTPSSQSYTAGTRFNFKFYTVSYSPLTNWDNNFNKTMISRDYEYWTKFPGNSSEVGFKDYVSLPLSNVTKFTTNSTIARSEMYRRYSGQYIMFYDHPVNSSVKWKFDNGTTVGAQSGYDSTTKLFTISLSGSSVATLFVQAGTSVSISDTLTNTDSLARLITVARSLSDTLTISDVLERLLNMGRSLSDTLTITDSLSRLLVFGRSISETLSISDSIFTLKVILRSMADTVALSDSISRAIIVARAIAETFTLSISLASQGGTISVAVFDPGCACYVRNPTLPLVFIAEARQDAISKIVSMRVKTVPGTIAIFYIDNKWVNGTLVTADETIFNYDASSLPAGNHTAKVEVKTVAGDYRSIAESQFTIMSDEELLFRSQMQGLLVIVVIVAVVGIVWYARRR
ncbi:MAG TPA: hypothetical protein VIH27_07265, partial [Nitrososphaerales archaeon]